MTRIRYKNSPLKEVIFQLRFPTQLSINAKEPVEFQERIGNQYPIYNKVLENTPNDGINISQQDDKSKRYEFISQDGLNKITLASSYISFSTLNYRIWENFKDNIKLITAYVLDIYKPKFFIRVGLRYKDVITRSHYGFDGKQWKELIKPEVIGIISEVDDINATQYQMQTVLKHSADKTMVRNMFALVRIQDETELSMLFDCDYFLQDITQIEDYLDVAEVLHAHSSNFIDRAITAELRAAMEPEEI